MSTRNSSSDVYVAGWPRSGNSWLAQLLGDVLDSPVTGLGSAMPIAAEGADRPGMYVVRQLHMKAVHRGPEQPAIVSAYAFNLDAYRDQHIVHVYRDPRDVAVSAWQFFGYPSLLETIQSMAGLASGALAVHGTWVDFVSGWLDAHLAYQWNISYEALIGNPVEVLETTLSALGITVEERRLDEAIYRQSFTVKRAQVEQDGNRRPYGKATQLKHLRRGIAGDWRNHFRHDEARLAHEHWWPLLKRLNYETDPEWWKVAERQKDRA